MSNYEAVLRRVVEESVGPCASQVDSRGEFPREAIDSLGDAGILGLTVSDAYGGGGAGLAEAVDVIRVLAGVCGSTAMIVLMHYAGTSVIQECGPQNVIEEIAKGTHLTTLAFSEVGSRSHFWSPLGTAETSNGKISLNAQKSWITSAGVAQSYVWSSRPINGDGAMTLWLVSSDSPGLSAPGRFDGLGLRGNQSVPVTATSVLIAPEARLGSDGEGLVLALTTALPWFLVLNAAFSVGLMEASIAQTGDHLASTTLAHTGETLAEMQLPRMDHARMRVATDQAAALLADTVSALSTGRDDAMLRTLEAKAACGEAAITVTDLAMKVCGGAAFRKELAIERRFRDARAARVMAPTTDALLDFIGRTINGQPLL